MLKTLSRLSQSAIDRTRALLGPTDDAPSAAATALDVRIVPPERHAVTQRRISRNALKVLNRLDEAGHAAYLVGGGVRDALVELNPKDFDVATDASPEAVRALFRNSRIIGRRFRLVHVVFGRDVIEVATFRAGHDKGEGGEIGESGRIVRDNVFGTIEEDALRRDFTVNALYYNIADQSVVDFVGGLDDIEAGVFRLIGDPLQRCQEDPVRVLRAVRLSAKLEFGIAAETLSAMRQSAPELAHTPPPRLFEEVLKLFQGGYAERSFNGVVEHDLLQYLFPLLDKRLKADRQADESTLRQMLDEALANTDRRVAQGKPITPAYLLAFMLWPDVQEKALADVGTGVAPLDALGDAADAVMAKQLRVISIPRRFSGPMREIWLLQPRLEQYRGKRALSLMENKRFRAAYDFLCLRASTDKALRSTADWWTRVQNLDAEAQTEFAEEKPVFASSWGDGKGAAKGAAKRPPGSDAESAPKRRRRRRRRKPGGGSARPDGAGGGSR